MDYIIAKDCYWIGSNVDNPTVEEVPGIFTYESAYCKILDLCMEECNILNAGEGNRFRYQSLGDQYDMAVLFWIGDGYRLVTGYNIVPVEEGASDG